jgi:SAM-dependent methyltransferase
MGVDNITKIYHAEWFKCHDEALDEYRMLGEFLADIFGADVASVLDVGCGKAFIIERLYELGYPVAGVDGSRDASWPASVARFCSTADITEGYNTDPRDLVICTEVAEHIPGHFADEVVSVLCRHARKYIYFTAAPPGQGGYDHINEQPFSYWEPKFNNKGWVVDTARTAAMREACGKMVKMSYFKTSSTIFRPRP